jgi:hypothetical protein
MSVAAATPTPVTLAAAIEQDLLFGTDFLSRPRASYDGDFKHLRGVYLIPGMRARDLRAYHNFMAPLLQEARTGVIRQSAPPATRQAMLTGQNGPGTSLLVPEYDQQSARLALHGAKMCALAATAGVCAYRAKYGKLPATLAELDKLQLQAPGGPFWSSARGVYYNVKGDQALVGVQVHPDQIARAGIDVASRRQLERSNSPFFGLNERGFFFII